MAELGPGRATLRVTVVSPGYPPDRGGVEEHVGQVATRLAAAGDDVRILAASADPALRGPVDRLQDGVAVRRYRSLPTPGMSTAPGLVLAGLRAAGAGDVLHVHSYHASCGFAAAAGLRHPVVFTPHYHGGGHTAVARAIHRAYGYAGRLLFRAARTVICVSEAEREAVERDFPVTRGRTVVIPNGADTRAIRAAQAWSDERPTVLAVGRLEPYKGHARVVAAMASVPDAQLVVVGRGPQRDELRAQAEQLGLRDRVRVLDDVSTPDLHRWLRTAGVLVSMSAHEAFGMAPVEAGAAGARTVLSDIPAHREIVREHLGDSARLVAAGPDGAPGSAAALGAAIGEAMVAGPRVHVEVPDWDDVAARTRAVYLSSIAGGTA